ncbi:MAG: tellurite resistance TerB family protein [Cytophagales bacterium]|nr:tellurite resistance TerB family protein [Cytophagales bacterium]
MGLFDFIFKDKDLNISNEKEAFYAIIYACAAVDGEIVLEEVQKMNSIVQSKELFKGADIDVLNDKARTLYKEAGSSSGTLIMKAIPKLGGSAKELCYITAMELFLADGNVQGSEKKLLEDLQDALEISDSRASELQKMVK